MWLFKEKLLFTSQFLVIYLFYKFLTKIKENIYKKVNILTIQKNFEGKFITFASINSLIKWKLQYYTLKQKDNYYVQSVNIEND